jgi:hypothetical protein
MELGRTPCGLSEPQFHSIFCPIVQPLDSFYLSSAAIKLLWPAVMPSPGIYHGLAFILGVWLFLLQQVQ